MADTAASTEGQKGPSTEPDKPKKPAALTASESDAQYQVQLARFGNNHEMLARQLWGEQLTARRRNREIREERDSLRARNPQGSVVLIGESVTDFNAYKALGSPADLKSRVESLTQIQAELAGSKRKEARAAAAKAHGYNGAVLSDRLDIARLDLEMREVLDGKGVKQQVAHVRKSGDEAAQWEKLPDVAERDWQEYLPALTALGQSTAAGPNAAPALSAPTISFPNNGAGGGSAGSVVDRFITNRDAAQAKRPNPLGAKGPAVVRTA